MKPSSHEGEDGNDEDEDPQPMASQSWDFLGKIHFCIFSKRPPDMVKAHAIDRMSARPTLYLYRQHE
jgi:hypothetical protein